LFSDYSVKLRFLWVPPGETIAYSGDENWGFPAGTILVKTFTYPDDLADPDSGRRLLETRLLVREAEKWAPHTYVWNDEQTEAVRKVAGGTIQAEFVDESGATIQNAYAVPNKNECFECHGEAGSTDTLGGRTRQLDRDNDYGSGAENQIDHMAALGLFETTPPASDQQARLSDPFGSGSLSDRARSYLDANCGHCHDASGTGSTGSGLRLDWDSTDPDTDDPANWGVCKIPTSAGGATCGVTFDVVPGSPESSILYCRLASAENEIRMSPVGRNLVHSEGVSLIEEWIRQMSGRCD
jgi:uncharacterized repeat protein (TIGR03806 family)